MGSYLTEGPIFMMGALPLWVLLTGVCVLRFPLNCFSIVLPRSETNFGKHFSLNLLTISTWSKLLCTGKSPRWTVTRVLGRPILDFQICTSNSPLVNHQPQPATNIKKLFSFRIELNDLSKNVFSLANFLRLEYWTSISEILNPKDSKV